MFGFGKTININRAAKVLRKEFQIELDDLPHRKPVDELFVAITAQGSLSHEAQVALLYRLVIMNFLGFFKIERDKGEEIPERFLFGMVEMIDRSVDWSERAADRIPLEKLTSNLNLSIDNYLKYFGFYRG